MDGQVKNIQMKWSDIRSQYPNKFILLGDLVEEKISAREVRILRGLVLEVSDEAKEIRRMYQLYRKQGHNVIYALPSTPHELIVEDVLFMGVLQ